MLTKFCQGVVALAIIGLVSFPGTVQAGKETDTLVYAVNTKLSNLDRYITTIPILNNIWYLINDRLITQDRNDYSFKPGLATEWKNVDPLTWEFKLRQGVKFHNGHEFTAEAIKFTIMEGILDPKRKSPYAGNFRWVKEIQIIDKFTLRVICHQPYPIVLYRLADLTPYDPAYIKEKGWAYAAENPVGTGPYKFARWERERQVEITANPEYWDKSLPYIKNMVFKAIPEIATRVAELRAGSVDLVQTLEPDKTDQVTVDPKLKVVSGPITRFMFWQFDGSGRAGKTPVTDIRVRKAIGHAIDRRGIVKNVLKGYADVTDVPCNRFLFGYDPKAKGDFEYNPAKAKALLKEAGYENGFEIDLWQYDGVSNLLNQAAMGYLAQVGIKINLRDYRGNVGQMITLRNSGKIKGIACYNWGTGGVFDADGLLASWFLIKDSKNYNPDPDLDQWLTQAAGSLDEPLRRELYSKVQRRIVEKAYWIPMFDWHLVVGAKKNLDVKAEPYEMLLLQYARWLD